MITILNTCPICSKSNVLEFENDFAGDDMPDGPWETPCGNCADTLADALHAEDSESNNSVFVELLEQCLHLSSEAIAAARKLITVWQAA